MACINPNSPEFKEILSKVNNPLLAEIEMDKSISTNDTNLVDNNTSVNNPTIQETNNFDNTKQNVQDLFETDAELANAVYEALGLKSKLSDIKPKVSITNYRNVTKQDKQNAVNGDIEAQKKWMIEEISEFYEAVDGFNNNTMSIDDVGEEVLGLFRTAQQFPEVKDFINPYIEDVQIALDNINKKEQYDKFKSKKTAKGQAEDMTFDNLFDFVNSFPNSTSQIAPQQKTAAQKIYTQYLQSLNKSDTNPILQDKPSIITPNDRIIFGHPGIGKTFAKKSNDFIDVDEDYKEEHTMQKILRNHAKNTGKEEDLKAWEDYVTDWWTKVKSDAVKSGKQIFVSNLPILRLFPQDFDKVITISEETFVNRAKQRNDYIQGDTEDWKNSLDIEIAKIDKSKVVTTDKYLSDLFDNTKQEQVKKFVELQERLNNKEFVEGAKNVYDNSKELQELGTQEQYINFIAKVALGIVRNPSSGEFNNSKVTDVVYHGTGKYNEEEILLNGFDSTLQGENKVIFFTGDINQSFSRLGGTINAIVNIEQLFNNRFTSLLNKANENSNSFYYPTEEDVNSSLYEIIKKRNPGNIFIDNYGKTAEVTVISSDQIHILSSKQDTEGFKQHVSTVDDTSENNKDTYYQKVTDTVSPFEQMSKIDQVAFEKTVRDLAARMSDRIGIPYKIINNVNEKYKGKLSNGTAYINLAYCDMSSAIHEILGHPIIKSIKNTNLKLYQNLLKELESGKGEEILNRVKRDYVRKFSTFNYESLQQEEKENIYYDWYYNWIASFENENEDENENEEGGGDWHPSNAEKEAAFNKYIEDKSFSGEYTLEEQQEEAIVELMSLMVADKLDKVKDKNLISLLKQLLKEMKQFVRALLSQREVEIDKLPTSMTINDLSDLLAYSNNKLILPGYEVEYTTPDDIKFKTYQEASNHISELAKNVKKVDLDTPLIFKNKNPKNKNGDIITSPFDIKKIKYIEFSKDADEFVGDIYITFEDNTKKTVFSEEISKEEYKFLSENRYNTVYNSLSDFINKNKEYEQSKEIIEEWKKVNNIQYNPEEIYSRGQEFSSVVGAYSSFDVNLMMQNLLYHIEDNEKAGGKFAISAYTKPIDKQIGHLEGGGGKIKFKLYPKSEDILWASNIDVYSGSVWDASKKINKDKKSELLGVSYTKYPSLGKISTVQPNLAAIIDYLNHQHNELGISLNFSNFEIEVDEDVPYQTKKIIENVNKILQQKRLEQINDFINKLEKEC